MRSKLLAVIYVVSAAVLPAAALAQPLPVYDGAMTFQSIQGPEDPEEFSWEMNLGEEEELRAIDERHAAVFYTNPAHFAFEIEATSAHDAEGATVPTTLTVTQPNIVTLVVHHRSAPFIYPVTQGAGWEGGLQSVEIEGPPDESQVAYPPTREILEPHCIVPDLTGRSLRASRKIAHAAHCRLGAVRGERRREAHVVKQYRRYGNSLPIWTRVDVKVTAP